MPTTDGTKPAGKSGRRKGKGSSAKKRLPEKSLPESPAAAQLQSPDQDQHCSRSPITRRPRRWISSPPSRSLSSPCHRSLSSPPSHYPSRNPPLRSRLPSPRRPSPGSPTPSASRAGIVRACAGEPADHRECLSRLHQEIDRGVRIVCRTAQRRSLARQGDDGSERIREAGLRDSVAELQKICELHNRLAKQTSSHSGIDGQAPDARQVLRSRKTAWRELRKQRLRFSGAFLQDRSGRAASFRRRSGAAHVMPLRPVAAAPGPHDPAGECR